MAHKKQKPLPSTHPRLRIVAELQKIREEGTEFPEHPSPKRITQMRKDERKTHKLLKKKEQKRNTPKTKAFVGWEYKDRYSHRKTQ
jgi:hypothetical protein